MQYVSETRVFAGRTVRRELCEFLGVRYYRYPDAEKESDRRYFKRQGACLHRVVWEYANGPIPEGYQVHHKDIDTSNNELENLELLPVLEHMRLHHAGICTDAMRENLERIRPLASAWHSSEEGKAWHSEAGKKAWKTRESRTLDCQFCGKPYETRDLCEDCKYCSNNCRAAARRASGVDDEDRACIHCGTTYRANRYSYRKSCSRECGRRARRGNGDGL
jgi:hypothetical protein